MATTFVLKALAPVAFVAAALAVDTANAAVNYPWCAHYMMQSGPNSCGFATLEQCRATVSGIGGFCDVNPFFVPATPATLRPRRNRRG
jgi:hypothetical protein